MTTIRLENVEKRFGDLAVIQGLNLDIGDGEFFTLVGPSGCGKSTILNMIAGLEPVSGGRISFDGLEVNDLSPRKRDVAMVFQSYALYPHMSVFENMAFPLRMAKMPADQIDTAVKAAATLLNVEGLLNRKPKELSGGQRQRVALGRAIVRRPRVFLMDEPLSNLDARLRVGMRGELKRLHRELGITTVYVTHDQEEAMSLSDRIAVLHEGKVQQCGTPLEVYQRPANFFVAGFIGNAPMNFFPSTLLSAEFPDIAASEELKAGLRPEDVTVSAEKSGQALEAEIIMTEPAGAFDWADCTWKGVKIRGMSSPGAGLRPGSRVYISFRSDRVHLFDTRSGKRA